MTKEQAQFLIDNYPQKGIKELAEITGLSRTTVNRFLRRQNIYVKKLHGLNEEEKQYILQNYKNMSASAIARNINRGQTVVLNYMNKEKLKHKKTTRREPFSEAEIKFVLENYQKFTRTELCKKMNRGHDTIRKILRQYNVYENPQVYKFTQAQEEFIINNHKTMTCSAIGRAIGTNDGVVERYLKANNLEIYRVLRRKRKGLQC